MYQKETHQSTVGQGRSIDEQGKSEELGVLGWGWTGWELTVWCDNHGILGSVTTTIRSTAK